LERRYRIYDVFTSTPLAGNPLAVVLDADGLDDGAMQGIAREFNLLETVFALPPRNPAHSAHIRIFTPAGELPFAGHATVGTAVCLAEERFGRDGTERDAMIVLEEEIGIVRCGVKLGGGAAFSEFDCPKLPEPAGRPATNDVLAVALGLGLAEIGFENHRPTVWSAGSPFVFVPVRNLAALASAGVQAGVWAGAFGERGAFVYTRHAPEHEHDFRARMFAPALGIAEDPATGSAAAAFAGAIHRFDALPDGRHRYLVEQGFEMGRPSLMELEILVEAKEIDTVRIGGNAVLLASGLLHA